MRPPTIATAVIAVISALQGGLAADSTSGVAQGGKPYAGLKRRASSATSASPSLTVDLGYEIYTGVANPSTGVNFWKGIRFAAPPTGSLRWQPPQAPAVNRSNPIPADSFASQCPQSSFATGGPNPTVYGDEDCLFLNVYAPANAQNLPVLVWVHGGGYGLGNSQQDMSSIIQQNNHGFVAVAIEYRLGAFGFLSSDEVFRNGVVNAGLLDQQFALEWVQSHIRKFGGDPSRVTVSGESAGGGSVMLLSMAYGGSLGESLFANAFAASPYLPWQYGYKDWYPSQCYYAFAEQAGCSVSSRYGASSQTIFECLVSKDTVTLQNASNVVSTSGVYGTWAFLPVTDGKYVQQLPSQQLDKHQVNGRRVLVGNNAQEGSLFTPRDISTEDDFVAWLRLSFPMFTNDNIADILSHYPSTNASDNPNAVRFATSGYGGPSAINQSESATGQQQRANNVYAEVTFVCPSYWLSEAFSGGGRDSYRYQYSVVAATHGSDVSGYFGPPAPNQGPDFALAFAQIVGSFVMNDNPSISAAVANGASSGHKNAANPATHWPQYSLAAPYQLDLNQTGGTPSVSYATGVSVTSLVEPGLMNNITLANAYTWEAGRGYRCDFWRNIGALVPE